jgi:hypothetical protein
MKKHAVLLVAFILLFSFGHKSLGNSNTESSAKEFNVNPDTIPADVSFGTIKINPFQLLFSEFPVSFEMDLPRDRSVQFQVGYIFPIESIKIFEQNGTNADASSEGLFSYRNSPYNNHGVSFKFEFRKYGKRSYYGPQLMYKYCFYKASVFPVYEGGVTVNQTESKFSNIFGFGFIFGQQNDNGDLVLDWYGGIGMRVRSMAVTVLMIENPAYRQGTTYPDSHETFISGYPFINFGLRIGVKLWKNVGV